MPCHERKVACDHILPVCQRCRATGRTEQCTYTLPAGSPSTPSSAPKRRRLSATAYSEVAAARATSSTPLPEPDEPAHPPPGYLGPTSFFPVFEEAQTHLLTPSMSESTAALADPSDSLASLTPGRPQEPEETLKLCLEVISCIPSRSVSEVLFARNINPNDTWLPGGRLRLAHSLYDAFGTSLEGTRRYPHLRDMANTLCSNSKARFNEDHEDPDEYMGAICGPQLRWEGLGMMFTYWAFSAALTRDVESDPGGQNVVTGRQMVLRFTKCVSKCIEICRKLRASPNTVFVFLCFRHVLLESNVSGDASEWTVFS